MKATKNTKTIGITAALTALVAIPLLWTTAVTAGPKKAQVLKQMAIPVLKVKGCEVTAKTSKGVYKPGDKVAIEVTVANKTGKAVEIPLNLRMERIAYGGGEVMSRMGPMPSQVFEKTLVVKLSPNEKTTVKVPTKVAIRAGDRMTVLAGSKGGSTMVLVSAAADSQPKHALGIAIR